MLKSFLSVLSTAGLQTRCLLIDLIALLAHRLNFLCHLSLMVFFKLLSLLCKFLSMVTLLLLEPVSQSIDLGIQTVKLLVEPLFLLGEDLEIKANVGSIVSLETTNIDLVL